MTIPKNRLFDLVLEKAHQLDAFKVYISNAEVSYRIADARYAPGRDGLVITAPPTEILESDLEELLAAADWSGPQAVDSYEHDGAMLTVKAGRYPHGLFVLIVKAHNFAAFVDSGRSRSHRPMGPFRRRLRGLLAMVKRPAGTRSGEEQPAPSTEATA